MGESCIVDEQAVAVYDQQGGAYEELIGSKRADPTLLAYIRRIRPGGFILDLGCGPALASAVMREQGLCVDPIDASDEMVILTNSTYDIGARKATFEDTNIVTALHCALKPDGVFHLAMRRRL